jgi:serpin B
MKKLLLTIGIFLASGMNMVAQDNQKSLQTAYLQFAFSFFEKIMEENGENAIFSPLSAQIALSMLQNGAVGNTLAQIQAALGTTGYSNEEVNLYNRELAETLIYRPPFSYSGSFFTEEEEREQYETSYPVCELSNGLWSQYGLPLFDSYRTLLENDYQATTGSIDFGSQEGIDEVNQWVDERTHHLIPSILDQPNEELVLLLANALYFKGSWTYPFDEYNTHKSLFRFSMGNTMEVDMMDGRDILKTASTDHFRTVTLPYGVFEDFSMTIFLPDADMLPPLTLDDWLAAMDNSDYKDVKLQLPKFEITGNYDLIESLKDFGMKDAFSIMDADFSKMSEVALFVSLIKQSARIIVDEKGTEAAAVTYIGMETGVGPEYEPEEFVVDHPFYFTIEHRPTHTVLFVGRMCQSDGFAASPSGITAPSGISRQSAPSLYDLSGRQLPSVPQKGIYILNGKKRTAKH